ncbi:hypothetical protein T265_08983 [Opisthorchis viverrini]|uniref:Uncharacterized protein n=1 Tax=Opisthorchis viverrini TaxID=6198 RepID=A0A074ZBQ7_OPIVI|nr:hypothetical protein T265_08983 [Opisthorchis viverrini]KER23037.1 hypothetical protein T265_08983 [Opisthorchis viverrini]
MRQLDFENNSTTSGGESKAKVAVVRARITNRKVRGSNPTSATRLPLSRLGQPGSIPALVLPSGGMAARHRKGATAERFFFFVSVFMNDAAVMQKKAATKFFNKGLTALAFGFMVLEITNGPTGIENNGRQVQQWCDCRKREMQATTQHRLWSEQPKSKLPGNLICPNNAASIDVPTQPLPTAQANVPGTFGRQLSDRRALCFSLPINNKENNTFLNPQNPSYIEAFIFRNLCQTSNDAETLYPTKIDVCMPPKHAWKTQGWSCISERQGRTYLIHISPFVCPVIQRRMNRDMYDVEVAFVPRAVRSLLVWISVNSCLSISSSNTVTASQHKKRCLLIVSAYAPTECSSDAEKDTFH